MTSKQQDDDKKNHDNSQDGYFGDWLKRNNIPEAALKGYMSESAQQAAGDALRGYLTKTALAKEFGVSERTIDRWRTVPNGIPYTTAGHTVLFYIESVRKWLAKRERHPNRRRAAA